MKTIQIAILLPFLAIIPLFLAAIVFLIGTEGKWTR